MTILRAIAAAVACALVVAPVALAGPAEDRCRDAAALSQTRDWEVVPAPEWPAGAPGLTGYAVDPIDPSNLFVTNGTAVMRSSDRGCSWSEAFVLPDTPSVEFPFAAATARIDRIVVPDHRGAHERVLLLVNEHSGEGRPHVVRSDDGGTTWASGDEGLPPVGRAEALRVTSSDPDTAYIGIDVGESAIDAIYASDDGGSTWSLRSQLTPGLAGFGIANFAVDPLVASDLWAWGPGGLHRSSDGGATFSPIEEFAGSPVNALALWHDRGADATLIAFRPDPGDALGSGDGGENWLRLGTPPDVRSVGYARLNGRMVAAAGDEVYGYHAASFAWVPLDAPFDDVTDLSADRADDLNFYGRTSEALVVYVGPGPAGDYIDDPDPLVDVPELKRPPELPAPEDPVLRPKGKRIVLGPGESRTVRYRLDLDRRRTPLDVFFLIDTSDSMDELIDGLRNSVAAIINGLHAEGIDVQFGIGEYRAYPDSQIPRPNEGNFVYRRDLDISPFSAAHQAALAALVADFGGRFESHLPALLHTASGLGEDVYPPGPSDSDVPPGQQANFRAKALRVVIHATDSEFGRQEGDREFEISDFGRINSPVYPTFAEVIGALNARHILHVGLGVGSPEQPPTNPYLRGGPTTMSDLQRMARATGALAPIGGVDCDGDGAADIGSGGPLACPLPRRSLGSGGSLVPAIVNLVKAVRDYAAISLEPARGGPVIRDVSPDSQEVSLQAGQQLDFRVTFSCPTRLLGRTVPVILEANAGHELGLDSAFATVVCSNSPFAAFQPLLGLFVPPIPPAPPGVTQSAPAAQSQAQAQFGFVAQKQEQPQLAFVNSGPALEAQKELAEEYAFSSLDRTPRDVPPERTLGAGALLMAFLFACTQVARQQVARVSRRR